MPVLFDSPQKIVLSFTTGYAFVPTYEFTDLPSEATAVILRVTKTSTTYSRLQVLEYYPEDEDDQTYLESSVIAGSYMANNGTLVELIRAYRGGGSLIYKSNHDLSMWLMGYFTEAEFVPYTTRSLFKVPTINTTYYQDVTGYDWYRENSTAYLFSGRWDGMYATQPNALQRIHLPLSSDDTLQYSPNNVVWPNDSGQILCRRTYENVDASIFVAGYFTCPLIKPELYSKNAKLFTGSNYPADSSDSAKWLANPEQLSPRVSFAIAGLHNEVLSTNNIYMFTRPSHTSSIDQGWRPSTSIGTVLSDTPYNVFVYASSNDGQEGKFYIWSCSSYFYQEYNFDQWMAYVAFPRSVQKLDVGSVEMDQLVLSEPAFIQNAPIVFSLPLVYRTVSGSYAWGESLGLYLSGGASNTTAADSLGGVESSTAAGADSLGDVTNRMAQLGGPTYRCFYIRNLSGTQTAYGLILWIENQPQLGSTVYVGVDPAGIGGVSQSIATEAIDPIGVDFKASSGADNAVYVGNLGPGESVPVWIKRDVPIGLQYSGTDAAVLAFSVMNNG